MRMLSTVVLAASGAALLASAAPAGAATLTADRACFIESQEIGLTGGGFAPGAPVSVSGPQIAVSGNAGPEGVFATPVKAPLLGTLKPTSRTITITATDATTNTLGSLDLQVTTAAFSTSTGFRSPRDKRTWKFSGLFQRPGKPIYGHFRNRGRTYANYRFGVPKGPCGKLTRRAPGIPARSVPAGLWTVQVDFSRTYNPKASPRLTGDTTVITTFG